MVRLTIVGYHYLMNIADFTGWIVCSTWWRHQMEISSAPLAFCAGNSPVTGEFPTQRPMTQSFHIFFDLSLNKRLSKQSRRWWFETPSRALWHHCLTHTINIIDTNDLKTQRYRYWLSFHKTNSAFGIVSLKIITFEYMGLLNFVVIYYHIYYGWSFVSLVGLYITHAFPS